MNLDDGSGPAHNSIEVNTDAAEGNVTLEPYVGMEFDSEDAARKFYVEYARQMGFVVRIMQRRRSGIDGRTLARRLGCNKQGFSPNHRGIYGSDKKSRPSAREGCKATILVKMEKSGKWVVTRFVKDHNHPLVACSNGFNNSEGQWSYLSSYPTLKQLTSRAIKIRRSRSLKWSWSIRSNYA
ncbi:protein FAR1-RELATED SEQUENCE 5-like isoform X2 [Momordica charantia]|uniref:Protein FAR1-RELATED SEQUENCE 5-like isoform X2 n=1 Tax=Momordica charantia TaxID=3673 RepID=A0A6J1CR93_MOMCH|nr:protein FAR1-RELATED SEQUENCE 5-like isoform X2 [Momordica charantia]